MDIQGRSFFNMDYPDMKVSFQNQKDEVVMPKPNTDTTVRKCVTGPLSGGGINHTKEIPLSFYFFFLNYEKFLTNYDKNQ